MAQRSEILDVDSLRNKIIGLGAKSIRKNYYPELQARINELEKTNKALVHEIDERLLSQAKVHASEEKFRTLFNAMTEMIVIHELVFDGQGTPVDYRLLQCNKAFTDITGIKSEDAIGKLGSEVYAVTPPPYFEEYSRVAQTGVPYTCSVLYKPMEKYFIISVVSPGKNTFATITTDITAIQQIKELVIAKNKELENYLYAASHDLRSPLVNIQGFSARLKKQTEEINRALCGIDAPTIAALPGLAEIKPVLSEGIPKSLDFIFANVAKMDKLINGLLQISRMGRLPLTVTRIDMNILVHAILDSFSLQLDQAHAETKIARLPDCFGDETLLNQMFTNIIGNAIKYRDPLRPLVISIDSTSRLRRNVYSITDTGIGIDKKYHERIWDVFYRIDWKGPVNGDGVGLSIVKRIVDKHSGRIWLESELGSGSTFFVELPAEPFSVIE